MSSKTILGDLDLRTALEKVETFDVGDALAVLNELEVPDAINELADQAAVSISRAVSTAADAIRPVVRPAGRSRPSAQRRRTKVIAGVVVVVAVAGGVYLWRRRSTPDPVTESA